MKAQIPKIERMDWSILCMLTVISCAFSFVGLGVTEAPVSEWRSTSAHQSVVYHLDASEPFSMMLYAGNNPFESFDVKISASPDGVTWQEKQTITLAYTCFQWRDVQSSSGQPLMLREPFVRMEIDQPGLSLLETAFLTKAGEPLPILSIADGEGYAGAYAPDLLIDEQQAVPSKPSYLNSMYFDEIHHATAGYEYATGSMSSEQTHPPLGKLLIMLGIKLFGMTPFGWRFSGALAGALVVPLLYVTGRLLFANRWFALLAAMLLRLDFLLFVQSRMATVDSFLVLFILASYTCFLYFVRSVEGPAPGKATYLSLGLSGLFFGFALATKWSAAFAGIGLFLLFVWVMVRMLVRLPSAQLNEDGHDKRANRKSIAHILCFALIAFVFLPGLIYGLSYLPDLVRSGSVTLSNFLGIQRMALAHHIGPQPHPFASRWYTWPLMTRPVWLYADGNPPAGKVSTILSMGNPILWWAGILAMLYLLYAWCAPHLKRQPSSDHRPAFLMLCILPQWLPWAFVERSTFLYHFLPVVPFLVLAITYFFQRLSLKRKRAALLASLCFLFVVLLAFIGFLPFATGWSMTAQWANAMNWLNESSIHPDRWLYY